MSTGPNAYNFYTSACLLLLCKRFDVLTNHTVVYKLNIAHQLKRPELCFQLSLVPNIMHDSVCNISDWDTVDLFKSQPVLQPHITQHPLVDDPMRTTFGVDLTFC